MSHRQLFSLLVCFNLFVAGIAFGAWKPASTVDEANAPIGHPDNQIAPGFALTKIAEGSDPLENPSGVITNFGNLNDFPPQTVERSKTEPDENTYLVFENGLGGPTPDFDYGTHFLFQGHENGGNLAYITRINMDVQDPAHRITLLTPVGSDGKTGFSSIDGSTWDPFTRTLLFTEEASSPTGGVIEVTPDWPPIVRRLDGIIGSSGFEGIHPDGNGNLLLAEDSGGTRVNVVRGDSTSPVAARQPNSFVYVFIPKNRSDLSEGGRLLAMRVFIDRAPIAFHQSDPVGDTFSDSQLKLNTPGTIWPFDWVTVHDTDTDGSAPFDANARAKAAGATPFKRPENLAFQPGKNFKTFFFDATGDTDSRAGNQPALAARGAWGAIFRVDLAGPRVVDGGLISLFFLGDAEHSSFDNLAFADQNTLLAGEDRGDLLHSQLGALDSIWSLSTRHSGGFDSVRRLIALGRDPESEHDSVLLAAATPGFQNDGDNEPTGLFASDGGTSVQQLLGRKTGQRDLRMFFTQQHGLNRVFEIVRGR
jgi:hypothetical protein